MTLPLENLSVGHIWCIRCRHDGISLSLFRKAKENIQLAWEIEMGRWFDPRSRCPSALRWRRSLGLDLRRIRWTGKITALHRLGSICTVRIITQVW